MIGLTVGLLGIQGTLKTSATLAITAPAVVMTLPMFNIIAAMVRRRLSGRRVDSPDRLHIHHRLLARGWTPWQVLCLLGALCLTTGPAGRHRGHDLPPRRPGVDRRRDPGGADESAAAVRPPQEFALARKPWWGRFGDTHNCGPEARGSHPRAGRLGVR